MGKSKQSLLVGHGTMGLVLCLWCAHQDSETQSPLPRETLEARAAGSGAGSEQSAAIEHPRRETLAYS